MCTLVVHLQMVGLLDMELEQNKVLAVEVASLLLWPCSHLFQDNQQVLVFSLEQSIHRFSL